MVLALFSERKWRAPAQMQPPSDQRLVAPGSLSPAHSRYNHEDPRLLILDMRREGRGADLLMPGYRNRNRPLNCPANRIDYLPVFA
jgi:hypothetical protein